MLSRPRSLTFVLDLCQRKPPTAAACCACAVLAWTAEAAAVATRGAENEDEPHSVIQKQTHHIYFAPVARASIAMQDPNATTL